MTQYVWKFILNTHEDFNKGVIVVAESLERALDKLHGREPSLITRVERGEEVRP